MTGGTVTKLGEHQNHPHTASGLEWFDNPVGENFIQLEVTEFTCLCPKTGQPDFATFTITYVPNERCVETKSLKLYLWSFRDRGAFHEAVTKEIHDALRDLLSPAWLSVLGRFNVRGGISEEVKCLSGEIPKALRRATYGG